MLLVTCYLLLVVVVVAVAVAVAVVAVNVVVLVAVVVVVVAVVWGGVEWGGALVCCFCLAWHLQPLQIPPIPRRGDWGEKLRPFHLAR